MALIFLLLGIGFLGLSFYYYTKKETVELTQGEVNKQKGDDFEEYIIQLLGKQEDIKFVGKVSDYHKNGVSALENMEPDLKFRLHNSPFAVECKWRKTFKRGNITWAQDYQVKNYKNYQKLKNEKVFVALGIGGEPNAPEKLYIIPLYRLTKGYVYEDFINDFEIKNRNEISEIMQQMVH